MPDLFQYYGLDWMALLFGVTGSWLIGGMRREGFFFSMSACLCGFIVAFMSGQYGFVVYNLILISLSTRGYIKWGSQQFKDERAQAIGAE